MREIRVSAVVMHRADGAVLMVRKRGTTTFMNPGGKPDPGEPPGQCAVREVREELGLVLDPDELVSLGQHTAPAANEADFLVRADVFLWPHEVVEEVRPDAEIDEIAWVRPDRPTTMPLAPLFTDRILPAMDRD